MAEILPGVYIDVRPEALIVSGPVSVGNIGIVGTGKAQIGPADDPTPAPPPNQPRTLSSFTDTQDVFGDYDEFDPEGVDGQSLVRALELAYAHGASTVVAVRTAGSDAGSYITALQRLLNEDAHIVVAAGQDESFGNDLETHVRIASDDTNRRERIGIIGSGDVRAGNDLLPGNVVNDEGRLIFVAPGIQTTDRAKARRLAENPPEEEETADVSLPGSYAAAAVAGMLSGRDPHISLTNKTLSVQGLQTRYTRADLEQLVGNRYLALEQRQGFRVVKGITTSNNTAWRQITTRRIVDFAKIGVRRAADSYIGLLNNDRVRKALAGSINGFLAGMVDDEMLVSYDLAVTATRQEEIQGVARVTMTLLPTFSIDFIRVVMFLG